MRHTILFMKASWYKGDETSLPDGTVVAEVLEASDSIPLYTALTVIM